MEKTKRIIFILMITLFGSCEIFKPSPDEEELIQDIEPTGVLDMAFIHRYQSLPATRVKKVDLCLAYTADDLYEGKFFTQANVSDAVVHYRFVLPPGEYFYYASIICLCGGDSCKYAGFPGQNGLVVAGGKVTVIKDQISTFSTQFH